MDALSFVMEILGWIVQIAKSVVVFVAILFALSLIRRLPDRIKIFLSALSASVLLLALLRENCASFLTAMPQRLYFSFDYLRRIYFFAKLIAFAVVSFGAAKVVAAHRVRIKARGGLYVADYRSSAMPSCSFLKTSPVLRR